MVQFRNVRFSNSAFSDLDNNARLALQTALHLNETYSAHLQQHDINRALRNTCHALEALDLLEWEYFSNARAESVSWLLNIKELVDPLDDEADLLLLHPSRFKTLIWLGLFNEGTVCKEFERLLCQLGGDGLVYGVIQKQLLASIVVCDCLLSLESAGVASAHWQEKRTIILDRLEAELHSFVYRGERNRHLLHDLGDASYALDVLIRSTRLGLKSNVATKLCEDMTEHLRHHNRPTPISSETLYCVIQLATHFHDIADVPQEIVRFFQTLRTRYDRNQLQKEHRTGYFHPLVLRALLTTYGDRLRDRMVTYLLQREVSAQGDDHAQSTSLRTRKFTELLGKRTKIDIVNFEELSGGLTQAEVFRINYRISVETVGEESERLQPSYTPPSIVVKATRPEKLVWSVERYQQLPVAVKPYFALHGGDPITVDGEAPTLAYLFLEDLSDDNYRTFRKLFDDLELNYHAREAKENLLHACRTLSQSMFDIYRQTLKTSTEFAGHQVSRLYFSVLERYLISIARPEHFPHLKTWFNGFWLGERRYASIQFYESKLDQYKARLRVPCLMLSHGDFHGRNVMLDNYFERIKLIDLEKIDEYGDYVYDFAQLLEDIALFRYVYDDSYSRHLASDDIRFPTKSPRADQIGNRIEYPAFSTLILVDFQRIILSELGAFARTINDVHWRERLWFATAVKLISLVHKQRDIGRATVFYVEAIKLLDVLVAHLEREEPLPEIPFVGQHPRPDISPDAAAEGVFPYVAKRIHSRIQEIAEASGVSLGIEVVAEGRIMRYYTATKSHPIFVLDAKREPTTLLLACESSVIADSFPTASSRNSKSPLRTVLKLSEESASDVEAILERCIPVLDHDAS